MSKFGLVFFIITICLNTLSCGGSSSDPSDSESHLPSLQYEIIDGSIVLPQGVAAAEVINARGSATVADGRFQIEIVQGSRLLAMAVDANGDPLAMGWLGEDSRELSSNTTAQVLMFFASAAMTSPYELQDAVQRALSQASETTTLAAAIDADLIASSGGLQSVSDATQEAIVAASQALFDHSGSGDISTSERGLILINPASGASGIELNIATGLGELTIINYYRRAAHVFVDRVSTFDENNIETPSPASIVSFDVNPVQGLEGGIGTISQILSGAVEAGGFSQSENIAYVPRSSAPVSLTNEPDATKTRYRVAVVGPGVSVGDALELSSAEQTKQEQVARAFIVKELILPIVIQILIPASDASEFFDSEIAGTVIQDTVNIVTLQAPQIWTLAEGGDYRGAFNAAFNTIVSSGTFRDALFGLILDRFFDLRSEAGEAALGRASAAAARFAAVTGVVDAATTAFDASVIGSAVAQSDIANTWTVDVADTVVRLSPPNGRVDPGDQLTLTATVPSAGDDVVFEYRFTTSGNFGTLQSTTTAAQGNEITSSSADVLYVADSNVEGTDTVEVEVLQIDLMNRISVGEATAVVTIEEGCEFDENDLQTVTVQKYTAVGQDDFDNDTAFAYWFFIWDLEPEVSAYDLTFRAGPAGDLFGDSIPHKDGNTITVRPVQPLGQYVYRYSTTDNLASRELNDFAEGVALGEDQGIYILSDIWQGLNANQDQLEGFNERVDSIDAKNLGTMAEFMPLCE